MTSKDDLFFSKRGFPPLHTLGVVTFGSSYPSVSSDDKYDDCLVSDVLLPHSAAVRADERFRFLFDFYDILFYMILVCE